MTTLAQIALRVARLVTDVTDGIATAGDTISLTDTTRLTQQNHLGTGPPSRPPDSSKVNGPFTWTPPLTPGAS